MMPLIAFALVTCQALVTDQMRGELLAVLPCLDLVEVAPTREAIQLSSFSWQLSRDQRYVQVKLPNLDVLFSRKTSELMVLLPWNRGKEHVSPELTHSEYVAKCKQLLAKLPPIQHDSIEIVEQIEPDVVTLRFVFQVEGRDCTNVASFRFDRQNRSLASMRIDERLDHSVFGRSAIQSRAECRLSAIEAYSSFHPYMTAQVTCEGVLQLGVLDMTPRAGMAQEVPTATAYAWEQHKSTPYYIFQLRPTVRPAGGWGDQQNVYVDARNARVLMIEAALVLGGGPRAKPGSLKHAMTLKTGGIEGNVKQASGEASGLPLLVEGSERVFRARYDADRGLVFLPWSDKWVAYRPDPGLAKAMAASVKQRRPAFGTKE